MLPCASCCLPLPLTKTTTRCTIKWKRRWRWIFSCCSWSWICSMKPVHLYNSCRLFCFWGLWLDLPMYRPSCGACKGARWGRSWTAWRIGLGMWTIYRWAQSCAEAHGKHQLNLKSGTRLRTASWSCLEFLGLWLCISNFARWWRGWREWWYNKPSKAQE